MKNIALIGNPNVGKTTLFNLLTKSKQKIGNYPGVTVEKKTGLLNNDISIIDLPGIYSLDNLSIEETITNDFLNNEKPNLILNIVDSSNLYKNLFLTLKLKKFNIKMILVLNMIDIAEKNNIHIDTKNLSKLLNIPVFKINSNKNIGVDKLISYLSQENETNYINKFKEPPDIFKEIKNITSKCVKTSKQNLNNTTNSIDKIVLNKFFSIPILILVFFIIFKLTFSVIGNPVSDLLDNLIQEHIVPFLSKIISPFSEVFKSFILDGIVSGISSVLVFLPIILTMFLCITFIESTGYMARANIIIDKFMRIFGLSGKAFMPFMISFGCTVPAIMATRTFENEEDRKLSIFLLPLVSCNARLPVYLLFTTIFFNKNQEIVIFFIYFIGILLAIIIGLIIKFFSPNKKREIFIFELPNYKSPSIKYMITQSFRKTSSFLKKIGVLILSISILIWFLSNFNFTGFVPTEESFLYSIGSFISPIFKPLGFGFPEASISLITGLLAKEVIISSMGVIFKGDLISTLPNFFTQISAFSFLIFVLLYTPCISVISVIKKEYGKKLAIISIIYQFLLAYSVSFLIFNLLNLVVTMYG